MKAVDQLEKIIDAQNSLELETCPVLMVPDHVRFDQPDDGQAHDNAFTATKAMFAVRHEAVRRDIGDVQMNITELAMFANDLVIDRVPDGTPHVGY